MYYDDDGGFYYIVIALLAVLLAAVLVILSPENTKDSKYCENSGAQYGFVDYHNTRYCVKNVDGNKMLIPLDRPD